MRVKYFWEKIKLPGLPVFPNKKDAFKIGNFVFAVDILAAEWLKPNAGANVVDILDPKAVDETRFILFAVAPNGNIDWVLLPIVLGAELAVELDDNVPKMQFDLIDSIAMVKRILLFHYP